MERSRPQSFPIQRALALLALTALPAVGSTQGPFPKLPEADGSGRIDAPLEATAWRSVGDGTTLRGSRQDLTVAYRRSGRAAYGAALAFRPGSLTEITTLELGFGDGGEGATVLVSLRNAKGEVHSWRAHRLTGERDTLSLDVADLTPDAFQNRGRSIGDFDASKAVILSITDIGGFFGAPTEDVRWSLRSVRFQKAEDSSVPDTADGRSAGQEQLLAALVRGQGAPESPLRLLLVEAMQDPKRPEPYLWLGLNQLWLAAEGDREDPRTLEHVLLAKSWFDRYRQSGGRDPRVPSWSVPVDLSVRNAFGRAGDDSDPVEPLRAAYRKDPGFHGFSMGLIGFSGQRDSEAFKQGLRAVRAAMAAGPSPSVENRPNWPHNVEGFLLFAADYEHRAGNSDAARRLLERIESRDDFSKWPYRSEVERRRQTWDRGELIDHTGGWMQARSCVICHRGS